MPQKKDTIAATRTAFRWDIPARYNIGVDVCDRVAAIDPDALAILDVAVDGTAKKCSFAALRDLSGQLANALSDHVTREDRVGVLLPQQVETAAAHIAVLKMGAIALPLFTQFGADALLHRLRDSGACVVVTNPEGARRLSQIRLQLPALQMVVSVGGGGDVSFNDFIAGQDAAFTAVDTAADDPAILIYTSGTTGHPKGALHAHRVLLGHLPGVEMSHDFFPQAGDRIWTPADWAWIGGLLDVLLPALHHGVPVVAHRFAKFEPAAAFDLMRRFGVRNAFLPPTALKMMRQMPEPPHLSLRSVASGGETLGKELISWGREVFGTTINEFYGQTECNMIVSSCGALAQAAPGVMGFAVPGHEVSVLDEYGCVCKPEQEGTIAVQAPDPAMFLGYWNQPEATAAKFMTYAGQRWLLTGDRGVATSNGRIRFVGRDDDVMNVSGYRIGPGEIEDCLLTHAAVQMAGVVGRPEPTRGTAVVAFVVLSKGRVGGPALARELATHIRVRLAPYEVPREVRFIPALPLTTTGKIIRAKLRGMLADEH